MSQLVVCSMLGLIVQVLMFWMSPLELTGLTRSISLYRDLDKGV